MAEPIFPHIQKSISDFMFDEEGNIPRGKVLTIGAMVLLLSVMFAEEAYAAHSSHRSHSSHSSHSSHGSGGVGSEHYSHVSHISHKSHSSSSTHASHGSSTHSNSSTEHYSNTPESIEHSSHSNAVPEPVVIHSSHENVAPSLEELNAIRAPESTATIFDPVNLGVVVSIEPPPPTTPIPTEGAQT